MVKAASLAPVVAVVLLASWREAAAASATCEDESGGAEESALLQKRSSLSSKDVGKRSSCHEDESCKPAIRAAQEDWKRAILNISAAYLALPRGEFVKIAADAVERLYGHELGPVMLKPTNAVEVPLRPTSMGALSYLVGYDALKPQGMKEDAGFAINGGKGWKKVVFDNDQLSCMDNVALARGHGHFTDAQTGAEVGFERSFVYKLTKEGKWKIILDHSSERA